MEIYIYTVQGRLIRRVKAAGSFYEGRNTVALEKEDMESLASGTYYYTVILSAGINRIERKGIMIILR